MTTHVPDRCAGRGRAFRAAVRITGGGALHDTGAQRGPTPRRS
jgi:hypothetical protein